MEYLNEYSFNNKEHICNFSKYMFITTLYQLSKHEKNAEKEGLCNLYLENDTEEKGFAPNLESRHSLYEQLQQCFTEDSIELWRSVVIYLENSNEKSLVLKNADGAAFKIAHGNMIDVCGYSTHFLQSNNFPHVHFLFKYKNENYVDTAINEIIRLLGINLTSTIISTMRSLCNRKIVNSEVKTTKIKIQNV